jgi:uncharacterized DUF497 family protein
MKEAFKGLVGFEWDDGNRDKNKVKHGVSTGETEQVFFNDPLIILEDEKHSQTEKRFAAFGTPDTGRKLVVVYTIRGDRIRAISARDMQKKERTFYEQQS